MREEENNQIIIKIYGLGFSVKFNLATTSIIFISISFGMRKPYVLMRVCVCVTSHNRLSLSNQNDETWKLKSHHSWRTHIHYSAFHSKWKWKHSNELTSPSLVACSLARASQLLKLSDKLNRSSGVWSARSGILLLIDMYFKFKQRVEPHVIDRMCTMLCIRPIDSSICSSIHCIIPFFSTQFVVVFLPFALHGRHLFLRRSFFFVCLLHETI